MLVLNEYYSSLEDQVNAINPAILQREVDETTIENLRQSVELSLIE